MRLTAPTAPWCRAVPRLFGHVVSTVPSTICCVWCVWSPDSGVGARARLSRSPVRDDACLQADPAKFQAKFGVGTESAAPLIEAKTLTIRKLLDVCPAGTPDPSPFIYNSTLYSMAGLAAVASLAHYTMKPVDPKYFEVEEAVKPAGATGGVVVDAESKEVPSGTTAR